jgi:predicted molibdopterin-dependent oxidoreductase YjgC
MVDKVKITIDGTVHEVTVGENVLQVCVDRGLLVPHFCYHKALGAVGSCRLCAAMIAPAKNKPARLEMTCMTRAADGMVITVNDPYAKDFRRGVIEYLMLNHPHEGCETYLEKPGPRPAHPPRDEPLHYLLPLCALLSRVCPGRRPRCVRFAGPRLLWQGA